MKGGGEEVEEFTEKAAGKDSDIQELLTEIARRYTCLLYTSFSGGHKRDSGHDPVRESGFGRSCGDSGAESWKPGFRRSQRLALGEA